MRREVLTPAPRQGSYGLVETTEKPFQLDRQQQKGKLEALVGGMLFGRRKGISDSYSGGEMALQVVNEGKVYVPAAQRLSMGDTLQDHMRQAEMLGIIATVYNGRFRQETDVPYRLGLILSDFLELLPADASAQLLRSASDPEVSEESDRRARTVGYAGPDTQSLATEASVLLPTEARHRIFEEMARLDPRVEGRPYLFFRQIVGNFHNMQTSFAGMKLIYANLQGEAASKKILEVQDDFVPLGEIMRAQFKK